MDSSCVKKFCPHSISTAPFLIPADFPCNLQERIPTISIPVQTFTVHACGQRDDVYHGVVFDGLDSVFTNSCVHTLHSVLKALNNRKYIFAVTLKNNFNTIKQQQKRIQAEKGGYSS